MMTPTDIHKLIIDLHDDVIHYGINIIAAIIIFIVGFLIAKISRRVLWKALDFKRVDPTVRIFLGHVVFILVITFTCIAALSKLGVQTGSLIAVVGAAGLAIAFSLRNSLSNFASGILLISFRPIRMGDNVQIGNEMGTVKEIQLLYTTITTFDNRRVIIPNAKLMNENIINMSSHQTRRNDIIVGISYSDSISKAREIILATLEAETRVLKEPTAPLVAVNEMGESSINLLVRYWTHRDDFMPTKLALNEAIKNALDKAKITIPFPQRDVHLYQ